MFVFGFCMPLFPQGINGYANISAISGRTLTVNNVSETNDTFEDGEYVIIMQMQDNVIGTNTTNASTFGNIAGVQSAGLYEIGVISSHTESGGLPNSIVLANSLGNTYNINANSSVQLITFRFMGVNYATTGTIGTTAWNGTIGGVTAMSVSSTFSLNHSISANQAGFTGGLKNTPNGYNSCNSTTYAAARSQTYACKGEGIYKNTNTAFACARGKIITGGGGGNDVNAGGGGGGNYSAGGGGGVGWTGTAAGCSPGAGGLGGIALGGSVSVSRFFMGGGGGGGHENNFNGAQGGNGGGIIIIKASTLITTSACSGVTISANGGTVTNVTNDAAGGGGAGGTIVFNVNTFNVVAGCPLVINADGGAGGSANQTGGDAHGGGGGGGQGAVIYSTAQPTTNMTTNTRPGAGGSSCSGCAASTNGTVGAGTSTSGIIPSAGSGPLPVELLGFQLSLGDYDDVKINWATAIEKSSDKFIVQRLSDNGGIIDLGELPSKGNYSNYYFYDSDPMVGLNYYRLVQVDKDGTQNYRGWQEISFEKKLGDPYVTIHPNPKASDQVLYIDFVGQRQTDIGVELYDALGSLRINTRLTPAEKTNQYQLITEFLDNGVYFLKISHRNGFFKHKLLIAN